MSLSFSLTHTHCICDCVYILYCTRSTRVQYFLILWRYIFISIYMYIKFSSVFLSMLKHEISYTYRLLWRVCMYWVANVTNMPLKMFTRTNWSNVFALTEEERISKRERAAYTAYIMSSLVLRVDIHFQMYYFYFKKKKKCRFKVCTILINIG